ncbi:MAG: DUF2254 domain-containing protein [Thauera propionica]|jgi:uncharacterized membrane protein|uniref:DUF2254 domain-containing protein n=1 Tax=Thauera TaxID=33057 RepID=UPI0023F3C782|nr:MULTISPECIES: DUF2254 domain-containing protein [Thauera]MDD3675870.1 DUF2254 domain-containing protein [Thauera propionica]MDY0047869.1 DUF2254 domain-containing protein [Thauera propionica]
MTRLRWYIIDLARSLWVRSSLFAVAGIASAVAGIVLEPLIPAAWSVRIGAESIGNVLQILASSMLAVATFSLATMVSAYAGASSATTPRVTELLISDSSAQNALATFVGSFLFSLVGIIALNAGVYGEGGRVVLFVGTLAVIVIIVLTLLRWIDLLARFGRVGDAIERVETAASNAMRTQARNPCFGAHMRVGPPPGDAWVTSDRIGYIQHIDLGALERVATEGNGEIHLEAVPGSFVDLAQPLVWLDFAPDEEGVRSIRAAFDIGRDRSFDQDPRFGVVVLAEIACKALSPAVNDAGTAIATLGALNRVLAILTEPPEENRTVAYAHVFVPPIAVEDVFEDAFSSISESGAASLAVGIRLQKTLKSLHRMGSSEFRSAAVRQSQLALKRARIALPLADDAARIEALALSD